MKLIDYKSVFKLNRFKVNGTLAGGINKTIQLYVQLVPKYLYVTGMMKSNGRKIDHHFGSVLEKKKPI